MIQDDQDEAWYFINARAVKQKIPQNEEGTPETQDNANSSKSPMIVHIDCLRKLEIYEQVRKKRENASKKLVVP